MSYIGKDVAPQPQGTYSQSEIDTQIDAVDGRIDATNIVVASNTASILI